MLCGKNYSQFKVQIFKNLPQSRGKQAHIDAVHRGLYYYGAWVTLHAVFRGTALIIIKNSAALARPLGR